MHYGKLFEYKLQYDNLLTVEEADRLPTHRLLTYFKKVRKLRYVGTCTCCGDKYPSCRDEEEYYSDCEMYVSQLKAILDTREHV